MSTVSKITRDTRFEELPELLTAREAAVWLKCSSQHIYNLVSAKQIPFRRIGTLIYVPKSFLNPQNVDQPMAGAL